MGTDKGYFLTSKSIFDSPIWKGSSDKMRLFLYLIKTAHYSDSPKKFPDFYQRYGEVVISMNKIIEDNKYMENKKLIVWSKSRVSRLLHYLQEHEYIKIIRNTFFLHINVTNYSIYQNHKNYDTKQMSNRYGTDMEQIWNESETDVALYKKEVVKKYKKEEKYKKGEELSPLTPLLKNNERDLFSEEDTEKTSGQRSDEERLSYQLLDCILKIKPDHSFAIQKPDINIWSNYFKSMIVNKLRSFDRINKVINWLPKDVFWKNKMLSNDVLLVFDRNFDMMEYQMLNNNGHTSDSNDIYEKFSRNMV